MNIGIIGAGSWGTAIAIMLAGNNHNIKLWSAVKDEIDLLNTYREHIHRLPGVKLPDNIVIEEDLETASSDCEILVLAVASPYVRVTSHNLCPFIKEGQIIVNVAKGIEDNSLLMLSEVIKEEIPQGKICVLSGPSHAEEVSKGIPTTVVVGAEDKKTAELIQDAFICNTFRVYTSPDIIGIELGGAIKNVIALAAGIVDGLGLGDNTKAALITRGIAEISRLGKAMGAHLETFAGLSGIGDLIVTCTSNHSRNHNAGYLIGTGKTMDEAIKEVAQVVEGINTAKAALALAKKYNVSMPLVEEVNNCLFEGKKAKDALADLITREKSSEFYSLAWNN